MMIIVKIDKYEEIERGARNMFQKTQYPSRQFLKKKTKQKQNKISSPNLDQMDQN